MPFDFQSIFHTCHLLQQLLEQCEKLSALCSFVGLATATKSTQTVLEVEEQAHLGVESQKTKPTSQVHHKLEPNKNLECSSAMKPMILSEIIPDGSPVAESARHEDAILPVWKSPSCNDNDGRSNLASIGTMCQANSALCHLANKTDDAGLASDQKEAVAESKPSCTEDNQNEFQEEMLLDENFGPPNLCTSSSNIEKESINYLEGNTIAETPSSLNTTLNLHGHCDSMVPIHDVCFPAAINQSAVLVNQYVDIDISEQPAEDFQVKNSEIEMEKELIEASKKCIEFDIGQSTIESARDRPQMNAMDETVTVPVNYIERSNMLVVRTMTPDEYALELKVDETKDSEISLIQQPTEVQITTPSGFEQTNQNNCSLEQDNLINEESSVP